MKPIYRELLIIVICLGLGYLISHYYLTNIHQRVYNCDLAEISPDFPQKAKEECRKLRNKDETSTSK